MGATTPEGKVKAKITAYLKKLPHLYYFTPIGSQFGRSGVPDIVICHRAHFVSIEVKAPGKLGTQTKLQRLAQREIERSGGVYLLVDRVEDVIAFFEGVMWSEK